MAYAVTHVIVAIVVLDLFRHYVFGKKKFPRFLLVIGGIAGLLPDIDVPLSWTYNFLTRNQSNFHGQFTHSIIFPLIFLTVGIIYYYHSNNLRKNKKWAQIFFVISAGWALHLPLDCLFGGYETFLWPLGIKTAFCPQWNLRDYAPGLDALILIAWLVHEEIHNRIKDYI
ncbi:MAG: metal-dependent hydrolase [Nanoarchaeota archaeon]|nr:metal-dependent hydrolase [Nanoarchaeota archaeon]MBU1643680.1 metal-dependent hydrolase [Nanoarchaeota archaeon]MBU1976778.1 metal-dependent hydrolase [Nanoarchaeota archaeon]